MEQRRILKFKKRNYVTSGSEAYIYRVDDGIYKKFKPSVSLEKRRRKEKKLKYLETLTKLKQYYPQIYYEIMALINGKLKGYVMEDIEGMQLVNGQLTFQEKKEHLTQLRTILEEFKEEGCFFFDIRNPNIRIVNGKIILLDIDSITTPEDTDLDIVPTDLTYYCSNGGSIDQFGQIFMFNILTRNCFQYEEKSYDKIASNILLDINHYDPGYYGDHEYLLDHISPPKK